MGSWIIRPEAYFWRTVRALRDSQDCNAIQKSYIQQASLSLIVGSQDTLDCTSCCWSWQFSLAPPSFYFSLNPQFWFTQQLGFFFFPQHHLPISTLWEYICQLLWIFEYYLIIYGSISFHPASEPRKTLMSLCNENAEFLEMSAFQEFRRSAWFS